jgi:hypothetical protein
MGGLSYLGKNKLQNLNKKKTKEKNLFFQSILYPSPFGRKSKIFEILVLNYR